MVFWLIVNYTCWLWKIGTDFSEATKTALNMFSVLETVLELALAITFIIGFIGRDE